MYDLNLVIFLQADIGPLLPPHHLLVQFNCYAIGGNGQLSQKLLQRDLVGEFARFTIYLNAQSFYTPISPDELHVVFRLTVRQPLL